MHIFLPLLAVLFIALKLLGIDPVAAWSWWWVTVPVWGPAVLALGLFAVFTVFGVVFMRNKSGWRI